MASPIKNPRIPIGSTVQHWPVIDDTKAHRDVARAIKLLYNSVDDHNQAFLAQAQKAQLVATVDTTNGQIPNVDVVIAGRYTNPPTLTAVGGGGSGAKFAVDLNPQTGEIRSVKIISPGSGYKSPPAIMVTSND